MGKILLRNITLNDRQKDILIEGQLISRIAESGSIAAEEGMEIMDCTHKVAVPGFINMHVHSGMTMMRGLGEDMLFHDWIDVIWKTEARMLNPEYILSATKLACLEMIKSGTTAFHDHYFYPEYGVRSIAEMGLTAYAGDVILGTFETAKAEAQKESVLRVLENSASWPEGVKPSIIVHAVYTVSEDMIRWAAELSDKYQLPLHVHASETAREVAECREAHGGLSPVEYLDSLGALTERTTAAHTLHLTEHDIEILGSRKVNCVHNINSNLKLASGYRFLYKELRQAGANVCLGTDGNASSNNLDILEAMKTSALVQKAWREDPSAWPLEELLECATVNGAKALGLKSGRIEEGYMADISIVDTDNTYFLSDAPFLANLIYSAHSDCIDSVIARGRFVMKGRRIEGESEILQQARTFLNNNK